MRESVPLHRNARFQLLWAGSFASALGSHVSAIGFPLLVLAITGSPVKAGAVRAAHLIAIVLLALPAGALVDRGDRRRILVGCEAVRAAALASVAGAVLAGRVGFAHLLVVAFVQGVAAALFNPARWVAVRAVVPPDQLRPAIGQDQARTHAAGIAGPFLGGALFGAGRAVPFLLDAVSYLVSLACVLAARVPRRPEPAGPPPSSDPVDGGRATGPAAAARWLWRQPFLRALGAFSLAVNLASGGLALSFVVLILERGGSPATVGAASAIAGAGGLAGAIVSPWLAGLTTPGRFTAAVGWTLAVLVPTMALPAPPLGPLGPLWPGLVLALIMLVMPASEVTAQTALLATVPDHLIGRIGSLLMTTSLCAAPLGPLLAGVLIDHRGAGPALAAQGAFLAAVAVAATLSPALRHQPSRAAPARSGHRRGPAA